MPTLMPLVRGAAFAVAIALSSTVARAQWITVYANDFETAPGAALSSSSGPLGLFAHYAGCSGAYCTTYLGLASGRLFANDDITLSLAALPAHTQIRASVDLLLFGTWDGNGAPGPDLLTFGSPGVATTTTSFATVPGAIQSFPGEYPSLNPANTGAVEVNTLGTHFGSPLSAVYHLTITLPDTRTNPVGFVFGSGLQDWTDEAFTIDNLRIEVLATPEPATLALLAPAALLIWVARGRSQNARKSFILRSLWISSASPSSSLRPARSTPSGQPSRTAPTPSTSAPPSSMPATTAPS